MSAKCHCKSFDECRSKHSIIECGVWRISEAIKHGNYKCMNFPSSFKFERVYDETNSGIFRFALKCLQYSESLWSENLHTTIHAFSKNVESELSDFNSFWWMMHKQLIEEIILQCIAVDLSTTQTDVDFIFSVLHIKNGYSSGFSNYNSEITTFLNKFNFDILDTATKDMIYSYFYQVFKTFDKAGRKRCGAAKYLLNKSYNALLDANLDLVNKNIPKLQNFDETNRNMFIKKSAERFAIVCNL
jgi:hypothetical protein